MMWGGVVCLVRAFLLNGYEYTWKSARTEKQSDDRTLYRMFHKRFGITFVAAASMGEHH